MIVRNLNACAPTPAIEKAKRLIGELEHNYHTNNERLANVRTYLLALTALSMTAHASWCWAGTGFKKGIAWWGPTRAPSPDQPTQCYHTSRV